MSLIGKGKNVQCLADQQKRYDEIKTSKIEFPGAYKVDTKVLALMRDNKTWKLAEIYQIRKAKLFNQDIQGDEQDDSEDEDSVLTNHYDQNAKGPLSTQEQIRIKNINQKRDKKLTYFQLYIQQLRESKVIGPSQNIRNLSDYQPKNYQVEDSLIFKPDDILKGFIKNQNIERNTQLELSQNNIEEDQENIEMSYQQNARQISLKEEQKIEEIEKSMRYEYYIHYLGIDRRNDRWVTEHFIKIDPEEIYKQEALINHEEEEKQQTACIEREKQYLFNDENHGMSEKDVQIFINQTKVKTVESIQFGEHWLETWYFTALPKEYHQKCLYICDFCLFFCVHKKEFQRHSKKCNQRHPPGDEIYRDSDISFFEVNGSSQRIYCENLSYISRMFLDHKNVNNSIEGFFFYILCEVKNDGFHFVGYFSKEKIREESENNLSCIMVMPFCQRSGYGKLLIEMSYQLSMIEQKPGGPERPLSDLGHRTYVSYWTRRVAKVLLDLDENENDITIKEIQKRTGMTEHDINYILNHQKIVRDDTLNCDRLFLEGILKLAGQPGRSIYKEKIRWKPYSINNEIKE